MLSQFIQSKLLTKTGKFNNRVTSVDWWEVRGYTSIYNKILETTQFLEINSSFTERCYYIFNGIETKQICEVCNENQKLFKGFSSGLSECCSKKCTLKSTSRVNNIKKTKLNRYGNESYVNQEKAKKTNLNRYGVEYSTQSDNMKDKTKKKKIELYGDQYYNNTPKAKKTNLERYGVEYTSQVRSIIEKIQNKKNENLPELRDKEWLIEQNKTKGITQIAEELNVTYRSVYLWFLKYNIPINSFISTYSKTQKEIYDFVESLGFITLLNDRTYIKPKELDILIPDKMIAIELNGCYWHAEDKERHLQKLNLCNSVNIKLLQFWDIEWYYKQEICKSIIKSNLGINEVIYARKCSLVDLTPKEYKEFIEENHIQGYAPASIRYGLIYNGKLVSCISFSKSRFDKNKKYELIRYANKLNTNVIGGFSKLLKYSKLESIITYCDLRLFTGNVYQAAGFTLTKTTNPGYFYYKSGIVKSRLQFQKHKLEKILPIYDSNLTEVQNTKNNGWIQVFDCGNGVWEL